MLPHLLVRLYISLLKDTEDEGYCTSIDDRFFPLGTAQLAGNPSANNFYYEKTCLPGVSAHEACTYRWGEIGGRWMIDSYWYCYRSFSFEKTRNTTLEGFVRKSLQVSDLSLLPLPYHTLSSLQVGSHEQCLSACLKETEFVCRSVNYNYDSYLCEMSTEDRRSKPTHLRRTTENTDYFDNNCLTRK